MRLTLMLSVAVLGASLTLTGCTKTDLVTPIAAPATSTPAAIQPTTTTDAPTETPTQTTESSAPEPEPTPEAPSYAGDYDGAFGTFAVVKKSGRGDAIVKLPAGLKGAVLTATHRGSSNFVIKSLDSGNQSLDLLVNDIGRYTGTTFISEDDSTPAKLKIEADGRWTITIRPVAQAPKLAGGKAAGSGDAVLLYEVAATDWRITHKGSSNFVVKAEGNGDGLLVNEIGRYDGVVPMSEGPAVLVIQADGKWTLAKQ